ncbi:hypothetical protein [Streptomyces sp. XD-27]|uniref:hypothetical protein n=1 Tax=Streptomyces sp. XD-27 TaxID=3062779 RepID=UPI0026F41AFD|nr:hypothetical protein [Streptomyces sp. XD-27]WKX72944.1 hypothetical protein Q3Y56_26315 [Streptomyces sp. XD-27]
MAAVGGGGARRGRAARWICALAAGAVWWWAAVRLAVQPGRTGPVEGLIAAGGWGLSLLPVHCVPRSGSGSRRGPSGGGTGRG